VSFASLVEQEKYQSACEANSVHIVTPDWIIHCVDAVSRIDEVRYHPRLLLTVSEEFVHQTSSAASVQSLSQRNCQKDIVEPASSVVVSDSSVGTRPCVVTSVQKSVSVVPVSVIPTAPVSQQHVRTHLRSIGNGSEYVTEVCQSTLKPFGCSKVSATNFLLLYRPKPVHCNYQFVHYSGFCRISPSILNRFKQNLQA